MFDRFTAGVLGVVLSAALASAQSLSVSGGGVLGAGDQVEITYENPARANGSVVIVIDNGELPNTSVVEVVIQLDARGKGVGSWTVLNWTAANFNAPEVREVSCVVE